jgi:hypothetical protein
MTTELVTQTTTVVKPIAPPPQIIVKVDEASGIFPLTPDNRKKIHTALDGWLNRATRPHVDPGSGRAVFVIVIKE